MFGRHLHFLPLNLVSYFVVRRELDQFLYDLRFATARRNSGTSKRRKSVSRSTTRTSSFPGRIISPTWTSPTSRTLLAGTEEVNFEHFPDNVNLSCVVIFQLCSILWWSFSRSSFSSCWRRCRRGRKPPPQEGQDFFRPNFWPTSDQHLKHRDRGQEPKRWTSNIFQIM